MRYNRLYKDNNYLVPTNYTQQLSSYVVNLKYEDIPQNVIERAKMIMLQTLGVSLAAKDMEMAKKVRRIALEANNGEGGSTTAWITGEKVSPVNAALIAGTLADMLDWEDCSWTGHPSAGIIPVSWIVAEEKQKSGKDMLTAIVAAYEVYQRIAMAVQPTDEEWKREGWGLTSWQIFGGIIAAAKLYGFDQRKIDQAIGMGCECSTIPSSYHATTMSDFYHYEHGYRARDSVLIVKSVEKGIHNQRDALDCPRCYTDAMCENPDTDWFVKDLGKRYLIMETLLKHWPANMWVQSSTEAVYEIVMENGLKPEDIKEIIVDPGNGDRMWAPDEGFTSLTHAQFSTPFVISAMLYSHTPGAHWYTAENMKDPKIIDMMKRIKAGPSPMDYPLRGFSLFREGKYPMKNITLTTNDNKIFKKSLDCHKGHPSNMMSRDEFVERFRIQASPVLKGERLEEAIQLLTNIEACDNISNMSHILCV